MKIYIDQHTNITNGYDSLDIVNEDGTIVGHLYSEHYTRAQAEKLCEVWNQSLESEEE